LILETKKELFILFVILNKLLPTESSPHLEDPPYLEPVTLPEAGLPPALMVNPISAASASASRTLSMVVTASLYLVLFAGGFALMHLNQWTGSRPLEDRQTVRLMIQDGTAFNEPSGGGGRKTEESNAETRQVAVGAVEVPIPVALDTGVPETPLESLVPLEPPKGPQAFKSELMFAPLPIGSSGNGVGQGEGTGLGRGHGNGSRQGGGSTWIHSASGEDRIQLKENLMEVKDYIPPHYPSDARSAGICGDVVIEVTIDEAGKPMKWWVVDGDPLLVTASLIVLPKWQFIPVRYKGKKVRATFEVRIRFTLM
jgi:TonB family protein